MKKLKTIFKLLTFTFIIIFLYTNDFDILNQITDKFNEISTQNSIAMQIDSSLIKDSEISSLEDSGITGEELTFNETYYPYFGLLNSNQQILYKQVYANIEKIQTTFIPTATITTDEVSEAIGAVYNDHPELFWLDTSYSYKYTKDGNCVQVTLSYNSTSSNLEYYKSLFENSANEIINNANKLSTNYQKEKYVHDTIINNAEYDINANINQSAYSALVLHKTVCAGYARAFQYIMIELGIPTYYVEGTATEEHAWNIIKLSDGYYNVDLTWDEGDTAVYDYFNVSDSTLSKTHTRTNLSKLLPACTGSAYSNLETKSSSNSTTNISNDQKSNINNEQDNNTNSNQESNTNEDQNNTDNNQVENNKEKEQLHHKDNQENYPNIPIRIIK